MEKKLFVLLLFVELLTGCAVSDRQIGQSVQSVAPIAFIASFGFQYLLFRMWKRIRPNLTMSLVPNILFGCALLISAFLFGSVELLVISLIVFGTSYLAVLLLVIRVGLFFDRANVFTWASILAMSICIMPTVPMIAGLTEGTSYRSIVGLLWVTPGNACGYPGASTGILFVVLLAEAWVLKRRMATVPNT